MDIVKAYTELNALDMGFKKNDRDAILKVMQRCGATEDEIQKAIAACEEFGFQFSQMDRTSLKILFIQHLINEMRDSFIKEERILSGEVLTKAREAHAELLSSVRNEIEPISSRLIAQVGEVGQMISQLDPSGDLASRFSEAVLAGVSSGIQNQADALGVKLNDTLLVHDESFRKVNAELNELVKAQADEIKNIERINVGDLARPIAELLSAHIHESAEATAQQFEKTSGEVKEKLAAMGNAAISTVQRSCEQAVAEMDDVKISMLQVAAEAKNAIAEKTKWEWVKHAVLLSTVGLVVNLISIAVFFKFIWPHIG
jgi:hypothetical protein